MTPRHTSRFPLLLGSWVLLTASGALADAGYTAKATRTSEKITIDGKMDEPAWKTAPVLTDWYQTRNKSQRAVEQTEVRILYDDDNLYFGFHCLDSRPEKIRAYTVQNEGFLHGEDNVTVIIDTFLDHRNAYYFWTNMLGVRTDGRIADDGEAYNTDWQGEWESKGSLVSDGWVVEVRIPFRNFQFQPKAEQTFGLLLDREQVSRQEWSNWTPDGDNSAKVSRYPHLTGLRGIHPRSMFGITPYVGGQLQLPSSELHGSQGLDPKKLEPTANGGFDARYDPSPAHSVKLTVNPDFAEFDVDPEVLYLDTQQRFIPERRRFFQEAEELFTPLAANQQLFYSRTIAPHFTDHVWGGLRAVGKFGKTSYSVMDTQSNELHDFGPNVGKYERVNAGVFRVLQDVGNRSQLGIIGLQRAGDQRVGVVGADLNLHLFDEYFGMFQLARSFSPSNNDQAYAFHVGLHRFDTNWETWLTFQDIGKNFNDPLGFVPVVDKRAVVGHLDYDWFTKARVIPRLHMTFDSINRLNHGGDLTRARQSVFLQPYLNDDLALTFSAMYDYNTNPDPLDPNSSSHAVVFHDKMFNAGFIIKPNEWQNFSVSALRGTFIGTDLVGGQSALNLKFGPHVVLKLSTFYTRATGVPLNSLYHLPETNKDSGYTFGWYTQARYHFTQDLYTRLTLQGGRVIGTADLGGNEGTVIDAIVGWHYRMGSDLFVVYTEQPYQGLQQRRFLTKLSFEY